MKKEEIIRELSQHDGTILSFPDRGPWGENKYRGNCSGWIQAFLIWKFVEIFISDDSSFYGSPYFEGTIDELKNLLSKAVS